MLFTNVILCLAMKEDPVEGIAVDLPDESNLFEWDCYIEGPKDTP
jgi:ubiquitin-protein ligase